MRWLRMVGSVAVIAGLACAVAGAGETGGARPVEGDAARPPASLLRALREGRKQTIVAYGTSLTADAAWVSDLGKVLDDRFPGQVKLINSGRGGMSSEWGLQNVDTKVVHFNPDVVFIEFTINDSFIKHDMPIEQSRKNTEAMIDAIQKRIPSCQIFLMTMNDPIGEHLERRARVADFYQMYRDVAAARKVGLIDHEPHWKKLLETDKAKFDKYVPDGLHPNAEGQSAIITPAVLEALGLGRAATRSATTRDSDDH